jgi:intein/homing endonuclease
MIIDTWDEFKELAEELLKRKNLSNEYSNRLSYELEEIEKQAANEYWITLFNSKKKFDHNKSGLVLPWVLKLTDINPIEKEIKHDVKYQADFPDIDMDLLSDSRDPIKRHIIETYGKDNVCSVGSWQYYSPKSAMQDILATLQPDYESSIRKRHEVIDITSKLPDDFDKMSLAEALSPTDNHGKARPQEFEIFRNYYEANKNDVELAYRAVGLIKNQGQHAAGVIISSEPIKNYIPLVYKKKKDDTEGQWISEWTEGENAQLSKFGFVKFDLLGLLTLSYIYDCVTNLKLNKGIDVDLRNVDPEQNRAGTITIDGIINDIPFDDAAALKLGDSANTESIFQFDTHFMTEIIRKCGIKSFNDIVIINSLGRPGPLPMLDVWKKRRDGEETWEDKVHPKLHRILKDTFGVVCFDSNTLIRTASGQDKFIKDLHVGEFVYTYNIDKKIIEIKPIEKVGQTRFGDGLKITTDDNRSIITTDDHNFICYDNIKKANELVIGDLIPVPIKIDWNFKNEFIDTYNIRGDQKDWAFLIGYMVGDGCLSSCSAVLCASDCEIHADKLAKFIKDSFGLNTTKYWHCRSWYLTILDNADEYQQIDYDDTKEWWENVVKSKTVKEIKFILGKTEGHVSYKLRKYGLKRYKIHFNNRVRAVLNKLNLNCNVYNKRIPNVIYNSNEEVLCSFLAGLIESDGCISNATNVKNNRNTQLISFVSCNKNLLLDFSKALDILSIDHNFQKDRIFIWNHNRFLTKIVPFLKFKGCLFDRNNMTTGTNLGWIHKNAVRNFSKNNNISLRKISAKYGIHRGSFKTHNNYCRSTIGRRLKLIPNSIRYQKVKGIEKVDSKEYWGISVADNHTVIANGIIVKNCFQEQLSTTFIEFCGLTAPEAEAARKAVAKKHTEVYQSYFPRLLKGASNYLPQDKAKELIDSLESFGRYAFNKCLANDTLIKTTTGEIRIDELKIGDKVISYNDDRQIETIVKDIIIKRDELFEFTMDNGAVIKCTAEHKFLCADGKYYEMKDILADNLDIVEL